jgi:hypothetical protein
MFLVYLNILLHFLTLYFAQCGATSLGTQRPFVCYVVTCFNNNTSTTYMLRLHKVIMVRSKHVDPLWSSDNSFTSAARSCTLKTVLANHVTRLENYLKSEIFRLHSGGTRFDSRPRHYHSQFMFFLVFLSLPGKCQYNISNYDSTVFFHKTSSSLFSSHPAIQDHTYRLAPLTTL